jgi:amino acid transporter
MHTLGAPVMLGVVSAIVTWRTMSLGGTGGPAKSMNPTQLHALDQGYTFGLLWLAGVAVVVGVVALFIGYTAQQVAHAAEVKKAIEAGELELHP